MAARVLDRFVSCGGKAPMVQAKRADPDGGALRVSFEDGKGVVGASGIGHNYFEARGGKGLLLEVGETRGQPGGPVSRRDNYGGVGVMQPIVPGWYRKDEG